VAAVENDAEVELLSVAESSSASAVGANKVEEEEEGVARGDWAEAEALARVIIEAQSSRSVRACRGEM
jgi:hypothetical protein